MLLESSISQSRELSYQHVRPNALSMVFLRFKGYERIGYMPCPHWSCHEPISSEFPIKPVKNSESTAGFLAKLFRVSCSRPHILGQRSSPPALRAFCAGPLESIAPHASKVSSFNILEPHVCIGHMWYEDS